MTEPETEPDARQEDAERQPTDVMDPREMTTAEVQADTRAEGKSRPRLRTMRRPMPKTLAVCATAYAARALRRCGMELF
jgi:hypothetical protein